MSMYRCPACDTTVQATKRPWCSCNPRAPFRMVDVVVERVVLGVLKKMRQGA